MANHDLRFTPARIGAMESDQINLFYSEFRFEAHQLIYLAEALLGREPLFTKERDKFTPVEGLAIVCKR